MGLLLGRGFPQEGLGQWGPRWDTAVLNRVLSAAGMRVLALSLLESDWQGHMPVSELFEEGKEPRSWLLHSS